MPETETRWDLEIRIRPNGDAGYRGTYRIGEERTHFALPGDALDDNGWYLVARLEQSGLEPMLEHWRRRLAASEWASSISPADRRLAAFGFGVGLGLRNLSFAPTRGDEH